jgi:hypothetical protein
MHAHVCVWKVSMAPSKPTLPSNQAFVVQFRTRSRGTPSWEGRVEPHQSMVGAFAPRGHWPTANLSFLRFLKEAVSRKDMVCV